MRQRRFQGYKTTPMGFQPSASPKCVKSNTSSNTSSVAMDRPHCNSRNARHISSALSSTSRPPVVNGLHSVALMLLVTLLSPAGAFCPRGCICVELRVHCVSAQLEVIPILFNPDTLDLNLSQNRIKTILDGLVFYNKLQSLNLSHNEVVSLGTLNFEKQKSLNTLVINNNKVSGIQGRAFVGLSKLINLNLSVNYIQTIDRKAFSVLGKLRLLDLSNNRIKNLTVGIFTDLRFLKVLNLCKNELHEIPCMLFGQLRDLQELDLSSNRISLIKNCTFIDLKSLVSLNLSNNKISQIQEKAFRGLDSLRFLDLKGNMFTQVPTQILPSIMGLEELDIGINPLTSLLFGPFIHLVNLKSLHISRCENLSFIDDGAFTSLSKLTSLMMSFNPKLTSLHHNVFFPLVNLRKLVLRGNNLKTFDRSHVRATQLNSLDLRDNSLECNCSIKWLQDAAQNNSLLLNTEEILCAGPETLKGRSLSKLSEYDLQCYNSLLLMASCAAALIALILFVAAFGIFYYKNCRKMKVIVHDNWPEKIVATWKDSQYEKQVEDEEYTFHSLRGVQNIPVTVICQDLGKDQLMPSSNIFDELFEKRKAFKTSKSMEEGSKRINGHHINRRMTKDDYYSINRRISKDNYFSYIGRPAHEEKFSSLKKIRPSQANQEYHCGAFPVAREIKGDSTASSESSSSSRSTSKGSRIKYCAPASPGNIPAAVASTATVSRLHSSDIYSEPHYSRPKLSSTSSHNKSSKDSGYYSCEFLDERPSTGSTKEPPAGKGGRVVGRGGGNGKVAVSSSQSSRSLGRNLPPLPPSDSGIFTLSHVHSRASQYSFSSQQEGIYDNLKR